MDRVLLIWSIFGVLHVVIDLPIRACRRGEPMQVLGFIAVSAGCLGAVAVIVGVLAPDLTIVGAGAALIALAALSWLVFRAFPHGNRSTERTIRLG